MLLKISTCPGGIPQDNTPQDIDDLIYGDAGTVPSERLYMFSQS